MISNSSGNGPVSSCRKQLKDAGLTNSKASKKIAEWLKGSGGNLKYLQAQTHLEVALAKGQLATMSKKKPIKKKLSVQKQLDRRIAQRIARLGRKKSRRSSKSNKPILIYSGFESSRRRH
jgi:hypothetical protein